MLLDTESRPRPNLRSLQEKHEDDDRWFRARRHQFILSGLVVLLGLLFAGAAWYAYPILKRHDATQAQLSRAQQRLDNIDGNLQQQQSKLAGWANGQQQLRDEMSKLGQGMRARIEAVRKETGQTAENLFKAAQAQLERQLDGIKSRVAALETSHDADRTQIAALQEQLGQMRNQVSEQTQQLSEMRSQLADRDAATASRLASLQDSEQRDRQGVEAINNKLAVRRIDFEVAKGHSQDLAPGISLEITKTDVAYRRVSGRMWVLPDRRTVWLRRQDAGEPVEFYSDTDGKKRELVITNVSKGSVAGYLLLPQDGSAAEPATPPATGAQ